jgi:citrate lyase beta subunit
MRLTGIEAELDTLLAAADAELVPRVASGRQPVHTVYVPADEVTADLVPRWGETAHGYLGYLDTDVRLLVRGKLLREPIEDLRIDFEDGYGHRDAEEDTHVAAAARALHDAEQRPPFVGIRIKSLEPSTRARAVRTLEMFLAAWGEPFTITLPKVSHPAQVSALVLLCTRLEEAYGVTPLRFELQVELPAAILGTAGQATVAELITAADGRCSGLHYGTYDYSAALGIAPALQSMEHPVADHAKAVLQVAAAARGVWVSDGSTNVLPVGTAKQVHLAQELHARLVRRSLERGFYQGWDLHPGQLATRFGATYSFFRHGLPAARERLHDYLERRSTGVADEPATARALAGFLLRGLDCGAYDDTGFKREDLAALA